MCSSSLEVPWEQSQETKDLQQERSSPVGSSLQRGHVQVGQEVWSRLDAPGSRRRHYIWQRSGGTGPGVRHLSPSWNVRLVLRPPLRVLFCCNVKAVALREMAACCGGLREQPGRAPGLRCPRSAAAAVTGALSHHTQPVLWHSPADNSLFPQPSTVTSQPISFYPNAISTPSSESSPG